jgi:RHS repeat-associated protein
VTDDQNLTGYVQTMEEWVAEGYGFFELEKVYDYGLDLVAQTEFEPDPGSGSKFPVSSFYLYDCHGSVRALTDETGAITDAYTYDAFGIQLSQQVRNPASGLLEPVSTDNQYLLTDNQYRYCGEYFDEDSGMYYLRARHMNPETGRFHTLDEYEGNLTEPLSLHKYLYAHANPVMGSDPSGNMQFSLVGLMQTIYIRGISLAIRAPVPFTILSFAVGMLVPPEFEMTLQANGITGYVPFVGAGGATRRGSIRIWSWIKNSKLLQRVPYNKHTQNIHDAIGGDFDAMMKLIFGGGNNGNYKVALDAGRRFSVDVLFNNVMYEFKSGGIDREQLKWAVRHMNQKNIPLVYIFLKEPDNATKNLLAKNGVGYIMAY